MMKPYMEDFISVENYHDVLFFIIIKPHARKSVAEIIRKYSLVHVRS